MAKYKWYLSYSTNTRECWPIWKDDLAKEYTFEQGQYFRRAALSGNITFIAADYDWIMAIPFGTKIDVLLQIQWNQGDSYQDYWHGSFYLTDCTVNVDDKTISVKPDVEDRYKKILAGLDKEYDLIKLRPYTQFVSYKRRPLLQIYAIGDNIVSCFLGGMSWEQDVSIDDANSQQLQDTYHFGLIQEYVNITFDAAPPSLSNGLFGTWVDHGEQQGEWRDFGTDGGVYYATYFQYQEEVSSELWRCTNGLRIKSEAQDTPRWEYSQTTESTYPYGWALIPHQFVMRSLMQESDLNATQIKTDVFGRWLLAYQPTGAEKIPISDIVSYNRNYKYCMPCSNTDIIRTTSRSSVEPTKWGKTPNNRYYEKPLLSTEEALVTYAQYPVARASWEGFSIWLQWTTTLADQEAGLRYTTRLRDAYSLEEVLSALLKEIDNTITFAPTSAYSEFLYGTNPLMNDWGRLAITPKSNIKVAEYTLPAQKAPITLNSVLQMLKNVCGCYWFIDDSNRLRIEHISWFKNGGTYASGGALVIGYDLTAVKCMRNGQKWSLATGTYSFDKIEMPERYQYAWSDNTTDAFKGEAIEVLSGYVQNGKIEEINIADFNSDVDYIMLNPSDVSDDGFALMCCSVVGDTWALSFDTLSVNGDRVTMQNYQLSMIALQPALLVSDMPSWSVKVNGTMITAKGIQRMKKQQVSVPYVSNSDGNMSQLVKTTIGSGEVERASIKLTSRMTKFTLRYDTTEQ